MTIENQKDVLTHGANPRKVHLFKKSTRERVRLRLMDSYRIYFTQAKVDLMLSHWLRHLDFSKSEDQLREFWSEKAGLSFHCDIYLDFADYLEYSLDWDKIGLKKPEIPIFTATL